MTRSPPTRPNPCNGTGEDRFAAYLDEITAALKPASRTASARAYCTGLLLPGERKSVGPMAARPAPERVQAQHQAMHHVVAKAEWDDAAVIRAVRAWALPAIEHQGRIRYWIVDDTGFPKQGKHSVGVARQYCGQLGKQDSCQVAVSLSVANDHASLPVAYRLYLPETWAEDPARRAKAGVPEEVTFETKPAVALGQLRQAREDGVPAGVVLGDVGYGNETEFRVGVRALDHLVHAAKARWVIERDYQDLKQEIGLGHYEGRGWRGFHHRASLCVAAYGFLVAERCLFPPQHRFRRQQIEAPALPRGFQPRGAPDPA